MSETRGVDRTVVEPPDQQIEAAKDRNDMPTPKTDRTTSPAFQFYPKDFLSSSKVDEMSMTERGVYITLLSRCWMDKGLPTSMPALARMARMKPRQFERLWTHGNLHLCFYERAGRFQQVRLDVERAKQSEYRRRQSDRATKRWNPSENTRGADAVALQGPHAGETSSGNALQSAIAITSAIATKKKKEISAEPLHDSTPVLLTFPTVGHPPSWELHQSQIDKWVELYPNVNVEYEARKALGWVEADLQRRKTARGMGKFLVGWFGRAADRGGASPTLVSHGSRTAGNAEAFRRFIERGKASNE